ncbi:hypothetical protein E3T61_21080 [Cryobacterium lactosi]|uniref:GtrA-like protein domain-containing protein n=1 Tax=Cryobacterium lactosi TaxID=1259202 RepID=A0A4R9BGF0_9MICO|nr:hypothetical protein [Cryobacterium lactosi]TFD83532.1 hypothetical protein E3T61_21080 [Cryobacterium lactosi]
MITRIKASWSAFVEKRPAIAQFIVFTVLSIGMTVLQLIMMPVIKWIFGMTSLVDTGFQVLPVATNFDGSTYYLFDYAAGALPLGGGGLAYFLAVQITLAIAQVINFFAQRNITFKSNSSPWVAAFWYSAAYIVISFGAAALQGLYKAPVYELLISTWGLGASGEALADVITMLINAIISFWVFFPIFKVIFKREPDLEDGPTGAARHVEIGSAQR